MKQKLEPNWIVKDEPLMVSNAKLKVRLHIIGTYLEYFQHRYHKRNSASLNDHRLKPVG